MKYEKDHYVGNFGIRFEVTRFIVMPQDRSNLRATLFFPEAKTAAFEVHNQVLELYDRMLAKHLPCVMSVAFSMPLTRMQADWLNLQRMSIANVIGTAFGIGTKKISKLTGFLTGLGVREVVMRKLPTYHANDVLVGISAEVSGGIGPQRSATSLIIPLLGQ